MIGNIFHGNFAGMNGSALAADFYNHLFIDLNTFKGNGPVTTYAELDHSPYVKYLSTSESEIGRPLSANYIDKCEAVGELEQIAQCSSSGKYIDLPPLRGAIYIRNIITNKL